MANDDGVTIYYVFNSNRTELTVSYGGYSFKDYINEYRGSVVIPSSVVYAGKSYPVTSIDDYAFKGCYNLTSITIPEGVTSIGYEAFYECDLRSITIPESVTSIGDYAFYKCSYLKSVTINSNAIASKTYNSSSTLARIFGTQVKNYVFGDYVKNIGAYACYNCSDLTSVTIPGGVTSIGDFAFSGCSGLTSVTIPGGVTSIGGYAFSGCSGLTSVTIPGGVTSIGGYAFSGCYFANESFINNSLLSSSNIWGATLVDEETKDGLLINNHVVVKCRYWATSITIPEGVTSINSYAFSNCTYLKFITIPSSVTYIGKYAFMDCINAKICTIYSNSLTNIAKRVFYNCNKMTFYVNKGSLTQLSLWAEGIIPYDITTKEMLNIASMIAIQRQAATDLIAKIDELYVGYEYLLLLDNMPIQGRDHYQLVGLEPNTTYTLTATVSMKDKDGGNIVSCSVPGEISAQTSSLVFETLQPKIVKEGNVVVETFSNILYDEEKVGIEWRRTDWSNDFPSNTATAYLYEGTIQGYIRNLNTSYLWRFRPYYESAAGNRYYGSWMGIDPTNTSYFEPTVHTYAVKSVEGNHAQVKGYALTGTDKITSQGFAYWKAPADAKAELNKTPTKSLSVPDDAMTVTAKGTVMEANLKDLDYNTTYCYVAFVTTSEGENFYGEQQTFTTGENLTPVESIEEEPEAVTIEAIYDASGRKQSQLQKGLNIVRTKDGKTRKVMVK